MKTRTKKFKMIRTAGIFLVGALIWTAGAGDLNPVGPPAPTMKTLDEVQPRIPVHKADLPMTITSSGSYYLTEDCGPFDGAITIRADHVTLDLMGYCLYGDGTGSEHGITIDDEVYEARKNITIQNGTIRDFGGDGIGDYNSNDRNHRLLNMRILSNGGTGAHLYGEGHHVADCTFANNGGEGIRVENKSTLLFNTVKENGGFGILTEGRGCTINFNTVADNGSVGFWVEGSTLVGNTSIGNYTGIMANGSCTLVNNTCTSNEGSGIASYGNCHIINNLCYSNGSWEGDSGIYVAGSGNRVENNTVCDNFDVGIDVDDTNNIVLKNTASGNSTNYQIDAGNTYGPIVNMSAGGVIVTANPWTNFEY